jgi:hypothetical protein
VQLRRPRGRAGVARRHAPSEEAERSPGPARPGLTPLGGLLGTSFGRNEIVVRAGVPRSQGGEPLLVPAYATLGVGRSF